MKRYLSVSINTKLTVFVVFTTLFTVVLLGGALIYQKIASYDNRLTNEAQSIAESIANRSNAGVHFDDYGLIQENLDSLSYNQSVEIACVYLPEVGLIASYERTQWIRCPVYFRHDLSLKNDISATRAIIADTTQSVPDGYVFVQTNNNELISDLRSTLYVMIGVSSFLLAWAIAFSFFIKKYITYPLRDLYEATLKYQVDNDPIDIAPVSYDEVGTLVMAVRNMTVKIHLQNKQIKKQASELKKEVKRQTRSLTQANKELEAFSYSASHDLKSPVNETFVLANSIKFDQNTTLSESSIEDLNQILTINRRASRIIKGMIVLSGITQHQLSIEKVDLSKICNEAIDYLQTRDSDRSVEVRLQPGMQITGDEKLIDIMITNMLENAWKYTRKEEFPIIEVGATNNFYYIKDNGDGFDNRWIESLFTPYRRLHGADEFEGTGLGLATVKRITDKHGWYIEAIAEKGQGAEFRIYTNLDQKNINR